MCVFDVAVGNGDEMSGGANLVGVGVAGLWEGSRDR